MFEGGDPSPASIYRVAAAGGRVGRWVCLCVCWAAPQAPPLVAAVQRAGRERERERDCGLRPTQPSPAQPDLVHSPPRVRLPPSVLQDGAE